jgi:CheY-like chemotaxis protein
MATDGATGRPLILVVDDCEELREACVVACRLDGYPTIEAATANEALRQAVQHRPDLVILDLMLPGIPGWDVASLLKLDPRTRQIRILMVSGVLDSIDAVFTRRAEAVLRKPFGTTELLASVNRLVGDRLADDSTVD